jgi:hypothetical protein
VFVVQAGNRIFALDAAHIRRAMCEDYPTLPG